MIIEHENVKEESAVQLKGSLFTLTVLQLLTSDIDLIASNLESLSKQLPNFFQNTPVVIDLMHLANRSECHIDFSGLKSIMKRFRLVPVGVRNGSLIQQQSAIASDLAILPKSKEKETETSPIYQEDKPAPAVQAVAPVEAKPREQKSHSRLVTKPVRSGQQIYAKGGDLVVISSVGHGSELLADGNIHIYGKLNGRALAGIGGDTSVRIFCYGLNAELVSIAGYYLVKEEFQAVNDNKLVQIYLEDMKLKISTI